jgi:autotransporter-associated beta strand protein
VTGTARLNFDSSTGTIGGSIYGSQTGGSIQVTNAGTTAEDSFGDGGVGGVNTNLVTTATITNLSSTAGGTINAPIVLNPSGTSTRGDVTQEFFSPGSFTVSIGGTTGGDGLEIGTLGTSGGGVSGNSDVNIANSPLGGGAGTLILDTTSTYNGTTTINTGNATITEGVTNALPTNTDVIVGTIGNGMLGKPILDLNGNNQTVNSLSNGQYVTATHILTITNNNPDTTSTFTVSGSTTPWEDSASDDEAGYTGAITDGSATGGGVLNFAKGGSSTLVLDNTTYTGTTTVTGGTLILNDPTGLTQLGSGGNFVSTGGGSGNSQVFGGSLIRAIASDASFDGLGSQANGDLNTKADILLGSNSNDSTDDVTMQWRQRDTNETPGTQTTPPSDPTVDGLISDVLNLNLTGTAAPGSESDVFVLQMSFNPGNVVDEAAGAKAGFLRIDWLNPNGGGTGIPEWQNAILGDFATGTDTTSADKNFQGSFATFSADAGGLTDANVSNYLGSWGVDTTDNEVWAILDHNSSFAVVPEPSTALVGLVIGGMGILQRRRRRTKA